jgi:hypothetical protein
MVQQGGRSEEEKKTGWKKLVDKEPDPLPPRLAELISSLCLSFCNEPIGRKWFNTPALRDILVELKTFIK